MAQDYPGSNNMNLLEPCGQFGSRLMSGSDSASPRYIFTKMNDNTKYLFPRDTLEILEYKTEEGHLIEPIRFYPSLPVILINGTQGIGSGYSTFVPSFNPEDIKDAIVSLLENETPKQLIPWYKDFKGDISILKDGNFEIVCKPHKKGANFIISEIPIGTSITQFKELLESIDSITIVKNNSTENSVNFEIKYTGTAEELISKLKLKKKINCDNMHLFHDGTLKKFDTPLDILKTFVNDTLKFIEKKKKMDIKTMEQKISEMTFISRFISDIISEKIIIFKKPKKVIFDILLRHDYTEDIIPKLMAMNMYSFSEESITDINNKITEISKKKLILNETDTKDLFRQLINK